MNLRRMTRSGQLVEQRVHIGGDTRISGEETDVGIDQRGIGVVVAAADVAIAADSSISGSPHDQGELGVRLQAHESGENVDAVAPQASVPADVARLVESRFELDDHGYILARERRLP